MGWDGEFAEYNRRGRPGRPDMEEWDTREGLWGVSGSDPPAEQILRAVRPHMKVQKSRAPAVAATGWAWQPGPVKREASW